MAGLGLSGLDVSNRIKELLLRIYAVPLIGIISFTEQVQNGIQRGKHSCFTGLDMTRLGVAQLDITPEVRELYRSGFKHLAQTDWSID